MTDKNRRDKDRRLTLRESLDEEEESISEHLNLSRGTILRVEPEAFCEAFKGYRFMVALAPGIKNQVEVTGRLVGGAIEVVVLE